MTTVDDRAGWRQIVRVMAIPAVLVAIFVIVAIFRAF